MTDDRMTMDARAEAVEAMVDRVTGYEDEWTLPVIAEAMLDALLSPRTGPCSECGGNGRVLATVQATDGLGNKSEQVVGTAVCSVCDQSGQVSSPPLAVLMGSLEQVTSLSETGDNYGGHWWHK